MRDGTVTSLRGFDSYEIKLGDELRGERASRGKSLLDVQRELKIKAAYIDAIENCDATVFPNRGYVAGYVRAYARYLGRDADEIHGRFCAESGFEGINAALSEPRGRQRARGQVPQSAMRRDQDEMLKKARFLPGTARGFSLSALSGLGSVAVLAGLIGLIGYGGWYLLRDIQKIGFAPVAQAPAVSGVPRTPDLPDPSAETTLLPALERPRDVALHDIYAPRLEAPRVAPRDGPIAAIDPDRYGAFAPGTRPAPPAPAETVPPQMRAAPEAAPPPVPAAAPEVPRTVSVVARDDAWVRIFLEDGTIVFERILKPGESYDIAEDLVGPMLRAGNAGAVYLRVGAEVYGPLGKGASIARRVPLTANQIAASWPRATENDFTQGIVERAARLPAED